MQHLNSLHFLYISLKHIASLNFELICSCTNSTKENQYHFYLSSPEWYLQTFYYFLSIHHTGKMLFRLTFSCNNILYVHGCANVEFTLLSCHFWTEFSLLITTDWLHIYWYMVVVKHQIFLQNACTIEQGVVQCSVITPSFPEWEFHAFGHGTSYPKVWKLSLYQERLGWDMVQSF